MPSELAAYLEVVKECARERHRTLCVVDDGTGELWSTINYWMVPWEACEAYSVHPSGLVVKH
jgi:hypothetical protein